MDEVRTPFYRPIKKPRVFEEVCAQIRARIFEEALKPGDKLPAERDLSQQLGVGRAAVREALRALENAGIIELRKGVKGGAFIRHLTSDVVATSMRDMVYFRKVSLDDLIETRVLMNEIVIPLVCERATEEDFVALEHNVDSSEAAVGLSERLEITRQFYFLLGRAAHNQLVTTLLASITEVVLDFVAKGAPDPKAWPIARLADSRRKLIRCLRARDAAAALKESRKLGDELHRVLADLPLVQDA